MFYLPEGDKVQLWRQTARWALVTSTVTGAVGWVRRSGLGPIPEAVGTEPAPAAAPSPPPVALVIRPIRQSASRKAAPDTATAARPVPHPTGHRQHTGKIGDLAVTYTLDWQPSGELSGSYSYDQQPGKIFRLIGVIRPTGELNLLEFTKGRQSARGVLQQQGSGYSGQLLASDGRQLPITLE